MHPAPAAADAAGDRKRPRKQPPNQVWLDAIMSKTRSTEPSPINASGPPPAKQMRLANDAAPSWAHSAAAPTPAPSAYHGRPSRTPSPSMAGPLSPSTAMESSAVEPSPFADQLLVDHAALSNAVARALKELVAAVDCCFIARGMCHLCGGNDRNLVPVINFCPDFSPNHSLCREHLRSMHRVRLEDIFAGKNQPTVSKRSLRCSVCSLSCPCSKCQLEREDAVARYKQWLIAQHSERAAHAMAHGGRRARNPTPPLAVQDAGYTRVAMLANEAVCSRAQEKDPVPSRSAYFEEEKASAVYADDTSYEYDEPSNDEFQSALRADEKLPPRPHRVPKRAAKELVPYPLEAPGAGYGSRGSTPRDPFSGQFDATPGVDSPSAVSVLNCPDSEKSLVSLLSSLNQTVTSAVQYFADGGESSRVREAGDNHRRGHDGESMPSENESASRYKRVARVSSDSHDEGDSRARRLKRKRDGMTERTADERIRNDVGTGDRNSNSVESAEDSSYRRNAPAPVSTAERQTKPAGHGHASGPPTPSPTPKPSTRAKSAPIPPAEAKPASKRRNAPSEVPPAPPTSARKRKADAPAIPVADPASSRKTASDEAHRSRGRKPGTPQSKKKGKRAGYDSDEDIKTAPPGEDEDELEEDGTGDDESELDTNLDYCEVCLAAGDLVCCDVCPRSFHLKCLKMKENDLPEGDWQCAECRKPSYFDSFGAIVGEKTTVPAKCLQIIQCLKSHPFAKPFLLPVENVPNYTSIVKQPMDLSTIEQKLLDGKYLVNGKGTLQGASGMGKSLHLGSFAEDVRLVWANCKLFNDDGSGITRAADHLSDGFEKLYQDVLKFVEKLSQKSAQREEKKAAVPPSPSASAPLPATNTAIATTASAHRGRDSKPASTSSSSKDPESSAGSSSSAVTSTANPTGSKSDGKEDTSPSHGKTLLDANATKETTASSSSPSEPASGGQTEEKKGATSTPEKSWTEKPTAIDTTSSGAAGSSLPSPVTSTANSSSTSTPSPTLASKQKSESTHVVGSQTTITETAAAATVSPEKKVPASASSPSVKPAQPASSSPAGPTTNTEKAAVA